MEVRDYCYRDFTVMLDKSTRNNIQRVPRFCIRLGIYYMREDGKLTYSATWYPSHNVCNSIIDGFFARNVV